MAERKVSEGYELPRGAAYDRGIKIDLDEVLKHYNKDLNLINLFKSDVKMAVEVQFPPEIGLGNGLGPGNGWLLRKDLGDETHEYFLVTLNREDVVGKEYHQYEVNRLVGGLKILKDIKFRNVYRYP